MEARVKATGEIIKDVKVFEMDCFGDPVTYINDKVFPSVIYKAGDLEIGCDEPIELLTEQKVNDAYQERSGIAGDRANQLAWAFIIVLCAQLIGGSHFREPYIIAAGGIGYMMLSSLQALWQTVTMFILKQRIRNGFVTDDYPSWVGGGAWVFFCAKMIVLTVTAVYAVYNFMKLI